MILYVEISPSARLHRMSTQPSKRLLGRAILLTGASLALLLSACTTPKRDLALEQLSSQWQAEAAPTDRQLAPNVASDIDQDFARWRNSESKNQRTQLAYLVEKKIALFRAKVELQQDQLRLRQLEDDYRDLELQRSKLATERAHQETERLRLQSMADAEAAERARADAAAADAARIEQERLTELAQAEAEAARRLSAAEAERAELARREAQLRAEQLAALQQRVAGISSEKTNRGLVFVLNDQFFGSGQSNLSKANQAKLQLVADAISSYADLPVQVEGHTDGQGAEAANLTLSDQRAQSVKQALAMLGVTKERLSAKGFGETMPVASNKTEAGRAKNRRVEIIIEGAK